MDIQKTILIEKLNLEFQQLPKQKYKRRFSKAFRSRIRELFSLGLTVKEIHEQVPVSTYSIREWTKDLRQLQDEEVSTGSFVKVQATPFVEEKKLLFIFKHESGFSIEVTDPSSLEYLLYKLKSIR